MADTEAGGVAGTEAGCDRHRGEGHGEHKHGGRGRQRGP